jgi:NADPH2:quinone reductase
MKAIRVHQVGGPEAMVLDEIATPAPGAGEVLVRHSAIGLNFIDCYFRSGLYPAPNGLPLIPGSEAAGVIEALGAGVSGWSVGDRVAYVIGPGSYVEARAVPAEKLVRVPDGVSDEIAASIMLKGMTVQYLLRRTYKVGPGTTLLFHAAAGGVGLMAGQWAKHLGATVIGTAGGPEKCALAAAHGYDHVIDYRAEDFAPRVLDLTGGKGCDVVYDSIGKDTWERSIACLKPFGYFVTFGNASGPVPPLPLTALKGSLYVTRPSLFPYIATRADLEATAGELFDVVAQGIVKPPVPRRYALSDAVAAHADLEGRRTTGTCVLIP